MLNKNLNCHVSKRHIRLITNVYIYVSVLNKHQIPFTNKSICIYETVSKNDCGDFGTYEMLLNRGFTFIILESLRSHNVYGFK